MIIEEIKEALKETYPKDKAMRDTLELQYFKALSVIEWIELRIGLHKLSKEEWDEKYKEKDWCGVCGYPWDKCEFPENHRNTLKSERGKKDGE